MTSHLTDESFAALLAGETSPQILTPQVLAHLDTCEPCRREAEQLCGALAAFKQQSLAWAEARPVPMMRKPAVLLAYRRPLLAAAAALLVFAAVSGVFHAVDARQPVHEHAAGSLADDNRLLLSIDQELNVQDTSPRVLYAGKTSTRSTVSE
jgi:hypothetical protein